MAAAAAQEVKQDHEPAAKSNKEDDKRIAGTGPRGAFIVLEGLDRSGKTTQIQRLASVLSEQGVLVKTMRFPDRTTETGKTIDAYLSNKQHVAAIGKQAIHLLFVANRWEVSEQIKTWLAEGYTILCDRYAYSGTAYSVANGLDETWCMAPEAGLPGPDLVLFLHLTPEQQAARGEFGKERYETTAIQRKVAHVFSELRQDSIWRTIDAGQTMERVTADLTQQARIVIQSIRDQPTPFRVLNDMLQSVNDDGPTKVFTHPISGAHLYIGDKSDAINDILLKTLGITHRITVMEEKVESERGIVWSKHISIADRPEYAGLMGQYLRTTRQWIPHYLEQGFSILVHCAAGRSRSATVVADSLKLLHRGWTGAEAFAHLKSKRPIISPNKGFYKLICAHDTQILQKRSQTHASRPQPKQRPQLQQQPEPGKPGKQKEQIHVQLQAQAQPQAQAQAQPQAQAQAQPQAQPQL